MKRILLIICLPLICWRCDSVLDVEPETGVTYTNFYKTEQDFASATYQMHSFMRACLGWNPYTRIGMFADVVNSFSVEDMRNLDPSSILSFMGISWKEQYDIIYVANEMLDNAHRAESVPEGRLDFYLGQAYFGKALGYLNLARIWGDAIITLNSTNLKPYAKRPALEVINEAIKNGEKAFELLPIYENMVDQTGKKITTKQYGCKGSVAALLAHAYAWKGSIIELYKMNGENAGEAYEKAIYWSSELLDKKVGFYALEANPEEVCTKGMIGLGNSQESIFEFETDFLDEYYTCYAPVKFVTAWPVDETKFQGDYPYDVGLCVTANTAKQMYEAGKDKRRDAYFYKLDDPAVTDEWAYPYKIREAVYDNSWGWLEMKALKANWVYWRLADIYLLRAECYAKTGNSLAVNDLNVIRGRAGATLYPAPGEMDLKYAIFKEREKELLFEGHRYFDVIRNQYYRTELSEGFARLSESDVEAGALYMPIGSGAFRNNDILRQNKYWVQFQ